jgi:subfamily B ATP-binding cassette protein HlyB/CyaB
MARRQVGVVLQENVLFNRSIRDNIALADPGMAMDRIIKAAKLAGAHDFILELPARCSNSQSIPSAAL